MFGTIVIMLGIDAHIMFVFTNSTAHILASNQNEYCQTFVLSTVQDGLNEGIENIIIDVFQGCAQIPIVQMISFLTPCIDPTHY